jgi:predicted transcriptional regulator
MSTTIRVSETTRDRFAALARQTGRPMTQLIDDAADALERDLFFASFQEGFDVLSEDEESWTEIAAERQVEEASLSDASH